MAALATVVLLVSFSFDGAVIDFIAQHQNARLQAFGRYGSRYGDWPQHAALGALIWGIAWLRQSRRWKRIALMMLLASVVAGLSADAIRFATGRPRPSARVADGWYGPSIQYKYNSFPSGHTSASAGFFVVLALAEWPVGAVALVVPLAVGAARMLVNAHHLSDIVASLIVRVLAAYLVQRILWREKSAVP